jgi:hypothetical protein
MWNGGTMTELLGLSPTDWHREKPVISAHWGERSESAGAVATRLERTLEAVAAHGGPTRDDWRFAFDVMDPRQPLPSSHDDLESIVRGFTVMDDSGRPSAPSGFAVLLQSQGPTEHSATTISAHVGSELTTSSGLPNHVQVRWRATDDNLADVVGPLLTDVPDIVKTLAREWDALNSAISSTAIAKATRKLVPFSWPRLGAVTWIRDGAHSIPDTVNGASVERVDGGTLLIVEGPDGPSLRVDDVLAVYSTLIDGGHIGPLVAG